MTVGSCCEIQLGPPPDPLPGMFPRAGDITIERGGKVVATLDPSIMGTEYGLYAQDAPVSFGPGDALAVAGLGEGPVAPFTGTLQVPASVTGVNPALSTSPITIDRSDSFRFSWSPEGKVGEVMELAFNGPGLFVIGCHVPDAAGSIVVDASLLSALPTGGAELTALRVVPGTATGANVSVALIGETMIYGSATLK
jgi:hypothetical protein